METYHSLALSASSKPKMKAQAEGEAAEETREKSNSVGANEFR